MMHEHSCSRAVDALEVVLQEHARVIGAARSALFRAEHPELILDTKRQYREANRSDIRTRDADYRDQHREEISARRREYVAGHADEIRRYEEANRDRILERKRRYWKAKYQPSPRVNLGCGTNAAYARGCRCDQCVQAHREYQRNYRAVAS